MMASTVISGEERMVGEHQIMNEVISEDDSLIEEHQVKEEILSDDENTPSNFKVAHSICTCIPTPFKCICKSEDEEMTGELQQFKEENIIHETAGIPSSRISTHILTDIPFQFICKCKDESITDTNHVFVVPQIKEEIKNNINPATHQTTTDIPLPSIVLRRLTEDEIMRWSSTEGENQPSNDLKYVAVETSKLSNQFCDISESSDHTDIVHRKPYGCHICEVRAITPADLKRHLMTHNGEKPYACDSCDFKSARLQNLKTHKKKKHIGKQTSRSSRVDDHPSNSHTDYVCEKIEQQIIQRYACNTCEFKAVTPGNLALHMKIHNGEKHYACNLCDFRSLQLENLRVHEIENHTSEEPYFCESCGYKTGSLGDLKRHIRLHTGEEPYDHMSDDHSENMELQPPRKDRTDNVHSRKKPYACDMCEFRALTPCDLSRHQRTHNGEKPYACNMCDFRSARLQNLNDHKVIHTGNKPYLCDSCDYRAFRPKTLKLHKLSHTSGKLYSCGGCEYRTGTRRDLIRHIRKTHPCVKPYSSLCGVDKGKGDPLRPRTDLTDNVCYTKPYACEGCEFRAATQSKLKSHLKIHKGEKPFVCNVCQFRTTRHYNLKIHKMRRHSGTKPYSCDSCEYKTGTQGDLERHMRRLHTGNNPCSSEREDDRANEELLDPSESLTDDVIYLKNHTLVIKVISKQ